MVNKIWLYVAGAFAVLLAILGFEHKKNKELETDLTLANSDKKDAVLEQQQKDNQEKIKEEIKRAEAEKGRKLTTDEMEEFLKRI